MILRFFLAVHVYLNSKDCQIFTVHRVEHRELESAENFLSISLVFEIEAFCFVFNSVQ
jgi:hypothetical protein